ncbi:MAG: hypothetical protein HYR75_05430 [Gemmatimonadetes bacterium]|nr:hypothetical protein [Gemmatimonadota bacterium]MBI3567436.1 hypothetical protein [Gemmatimonadota bacterium]
MRLPARAIVLAIALLATAGCHFPYGFSGGGLPANIRTVAVLPFDNETASAELQRELSEALRKQFASRLGLREATEAKADAVVRGTIAKFSIDDPVGYSANPNQAVSARRRLSLVVDVEIIDQTTQKTLWSKKGITAQGEYSENAEADGRKQAVDRIVTEIIEGAQSQW